MPTKEKRTAGGNGAGPLRVLVAIPTSFQQEVVRFYLKDAGYQILGMVPSARISSRWPPTSSPKPSCCTRASRPSRVRG